MPGYKIDFEYPQFGDIVLNAENVEDAEELALEQVSDVHGINIEDITITTVTELTGPEIRT